MFPDDRADSTAPTGDDLYRLEALGAFAHELRTPLTSVHMILELARMQSPEGALVLKDDLPGLLLSSIDGLERLADEIQEFSRLERGRTRLQAVPCVLEELVAEAVAAVSRDVPRVTQRDIPAVAGTWDRRRLVQAFSALLVAANRAGDGLGHVQVTGSALPGSASLSFVNGTPGGAGRLVGADMGFGFFSARALLLAQGGTVQCERSEGFLSVTLSLPVETG